MVLELIVDWVIRIILFIYAVITTFVAIIKTKKANKATGQVIEAAEETSSLVKILNDTLTAMENAEELFDRIAKDTMKTGALKKEFVLNNINRKYENYVPMISDIIDKIVDFKNCGETDEVQSTGQTNKINFEIFGGNE